MVVRSKIIDVFGDPIPNVHVMYGSNGTITDSNGNFTVNANSGTITVSHIGLGTKTFAYNKVPSIIELEPFDEMLPEVTLNVKKNSYKTVIKVAAAAALLGGFILLSKDDTQKVSI